MRFRRSGTENLPGIAGFGRAAQQVPELLSDAGRIQGLRDRLEEGIRHIVKDRRVNGHSQHRLPNTLNVTLPEYYPTRCEAEILETHGGLLAETIGGGPVNLVELGAGDGAKTRILIPVLMDTCSALTYVPLDISGAAVRQCSQKLCRVYPDLRVRVQQPVRCKRVRIRCL